MEAVSRSRRGSSSSSLQRGVPLTATHATRDMHATHDPVRSDPPTRSDQLQRSATHATREMQATHDSVRADPPTRSDQLQGSAESLRPEQTPNLATTPYKTVLSRLTTQFDSMSVKCEDGKVRSRVEPTPSETQDREVGTQPSVRAKVNFARDGDTRSQAQVRAKKPTYRRPEQQVSTLLRAQPSRLSPIHLEQKDARDVPANHGDSRPSKVKTSASVARQLFTEDGADNAIDRESDLSLPAPLPYSGQRGTARREDLEAIARAIFEDELRKEEELRCDLAMGGAVGGRPATFTPSSVPMQDPSERDYLASETDPIPVETRSTVEPHGVVHEVPDTRYLEKDLSRVEGARQTNALKGADESVVGTLGSSRDHSLEMATFLNRPGYAKSLPSAKAGGGDISADARTLAREEARRLRRTGFVDVFGDDREDSRAQSASSRRANPSRREVDEQLTHDLSVDEHAQPGLCHQADSNVVVSAQELGQITQLLRELSSTQAQVLSSHSQLERKFQVLERNVDNVMKPHHTEGWQRQSTGPVYGGQAGYNPDRPSRDGISQDRQCLNESELSVQADMRRDIDILMKRDRRSNSRRVSRIPNDFLEAPVGFQRNHTSEVAKIGGRAIFTAPLKYSGTGDMHLMIWLQNLRDKQRSNDWSDPMTAKLLIDLCEGRARKCLEDPIRRGHGEDKLALMDALWNEFCGPAQVMQAKHKLHGLVQQPGESYYELAHKIENLCYTAFSNRNIDAAQDQALSYFELCVADPEIKRDLCRFPASTLNEAVQMAENYAVAMQLAPSQQPTSAFAVHAESDQDSLVAPMHKQNNHTSGSRTPLKAITAPPVEPKSDMYERLEKMEKLMTECLSKFENLSVGRGRVNTRGKARGKPTRPNQSAPRTNNNTCFRCGEQGHWQRDCKAHLCAPCYADIRESFQRETPKNE